MYKIRIVKPGAEIRDLDIHNLNFLLSLDAYAKSDTTEIDIDEMALHLVGMGFVSANEIAEQIKEYLQEQLHDK